ncbi:MAG: glycogen synthase GlgA [Verrucomicrobiota bacterium]|nr:glycogen synthase GlgA [Verrucomicrobiota bacterium]
MRIMQASGECFPYSKTGGLADMVGAMSKAMARSGVETQLVTPLYRGILERTPGLREMDWILELPVGERMVTGRVHCLEISRNFTVYFIEQNQFFDRSGIYGDSQGDYTDNDQRFLFFSKAVVHLARYLPNPPDIIHAHDWQVGMVPVLVQHQSLRNGWHTAPRTCFTIHNLAYQGNFHANSFAYTNLPNDYFGPHGVEFYEQVSFLKSGLVFADYLTTVSPGYASEILTEEFSCGMTGVLLSRADRLRGILNGVDYEEWNTVNNPKLDFAFDSNNMEGKSRQKKKLLQEMGMKPLSKAPLLAMVGRLVEQKGGDLLLPALHATLAHGYQLVMLGSGMPVYEEGFKRLARDYPHQVAVRLGYDNALAHRIEAASDFFLMPSKFEPCGLNQMYSLRYGSIPVVRTVGGLNDTVIGIEEDPDHANGVKFREYTVTALENAIERALHVYGDSTLLRRMRRNGMQQDFSWEKASKEYLAFYQEVMKASK